MLARDSMGLQTAGAGTHPTTIWTAMADLLEVGRSRAVRAAALSLAADENGSVSPPRARAAECVAAGAVEWMCAEWAVTQRGVGQRDGHDPIVAAGALIARRAAVLSTAEIEDLLRRVREGLEESLRGAGFTEGHLSACLRFTATYFARLHEGVREESRGPRSALPA